MNVKKAVELVKDDKKLGVITLFDDDSVGVCFEDKCYVTKPKQKEVFYIAQAWYSNLVPNLKIIDVDEKATLDTEVGSVDEIILLSSEGCPGCITLEELLSEEIQQKKIKKVDIKSKEGKELSSMLNIKETPTVVAIQNTEEGKTYRICKAEIEGDDLKIECEDGGYILKKNEK